MRTARVVKSLSDDSGNAQDMHVMPMHVTVAHTLQMSVQFVYQLFGGDDTSAGCCRARCLAYMLRGMHAQ